MNIRKHWKKLVLSATAFFWASCGDDNSTSAGIQPLPGSETNCTADGTDLNANCGGGMIALYGVAPVIDPETGDISSSDPCEGEGCALPTSSSSDEPESSSSVDPLAESHPLTLASAPTVRCTDEVKDSTNRGTYIEYNRTYNCTNDQKLSVDFYKKEDGQLVDRYTACAEHGGTKDVEKFYRDAVPSLDSAKINGELKAEIEAERLVNYTTEKMPRNIAEKAYHAMQDSIHNSETLSLQQKACLEQKADSLDNVYEILQREECLYGIFNYVNPNLGIYSSCMSGTSECPRIDATPKYIPPEDVLFYKCNDGTSVNNEENSLLKLQQEQARDKYLEVYDESYRNKYRARYEELYAERASAKEDSLNQEMNKVIDDCMNITESTGETPREPGETETTQN